MSPTISPASLSAAALVVAAADSAARDASLVGSGSRCWRLAADAHEVIIGRSRSADVRLRADQQVSGIHARLRHQGGGWVVEDDGMSRNGTYVNGERVHGRRALQPADRLRFGRTNLQFWMGAEGGAHALTSVMDALAAGGPTPPLPPTTTTLALRTGLSMPLVRSVLARLYAAHGFAGLPEAQARRRLADLAQVGR